jgi:hypothetical protein
MQEDCSSLQNKYSARVQGIIVHGLQAVRLQPFQILLDGFPGLNVRWTPVYVGRGVSFASTEVYQAILETSTQGLGDPDPNVMIHVDVTAKEVSPSRRIQKTSGTTRQPLGQRPG